MAAPQGAAAAAAAAMSMPTTATTTHNKNHLITIGHQKREELQKEVAMLQKLLSQEEKVHEILEAVHNGQNHGSAISIPSFLPPKMKELLAELVTVEAEITRLEHQISNLQHTRKHEHESHNVTARQPQQSVNGRPPAAPREMYNNNLSCPSPINGNNIVPERVAFETKAMHFISKAIKGDYNLKDFRAVSNPRSLFSDHKENEDVVGKFSRQTGRMLKPSSSPFRDSRHPTPKPRQPEIVLSSKSPLKPRTRPPQTNDKPIQKWEPNKLSESIIKCLLFIYVRLLRTSRAMELEKLGMVARTTQLNSSMNSSRSLRADIGLSSKPNSASESRQSDPYGVFDTEESIPRDIGPYKNLVRFTSSSMDSKCISSSSSMPLIKKLRELMTHLQSVDLNLLTNQQKLAFWINMYNSCVMHGFLQYGVPSTPAKLYALLNKATLNIGGNTINAQAIEYFILRKPSSSNNKEIFWRGDKEAKQAMVRGLYGLESPDPNVTFALCCGTRSSPAVRVYTADGVASELERSKLEYLQASIIVTNSKKIAFPELLLRNAADFATDAESLVEWVCHQLPTSGTLRKSMVDCFRGHGGGGQLVSITVEKIAYDYEFQYLLAM